MHISKQIDKTHNENSILPSYLLITMGSCELQNKEPTYDIYTCVYGSYKIHKNEYATHVLTSLPSPFFGISLLCLCAAKHTNYS